MTSSEKNNNRNRMEPFSHFINKMDRLFSKGHLKACLESLDDFFGSAKERSFPVDIHLKRIQNIPLPPPCPEFHAAKYQLMYWPIPVTISAKHGDRRA